MTHPNIPKTSENAPRPRFANSIMRLATGTICKTWDVLSGKAERQRMEALLSQCYGSPRTIADFVNDFRGMIKERRDQRGGNVSFRDLMYANGIGSESNVFDGLLNDYRLDKLPEGERRALRMYLFDKCGLLPGAS